MNYSQVIKTSSMSFSQSINQASNQSVSQSVIIVNKMVDRVERLEIAVESHALLRHLDVDWCVIGCRRHSSSNPDVWQTINDLIILVLELTQLSQLQDRMADKPYPLWVLYLVYYHTPLPL